MSNPLLSRFSSHLHRNILRPPFTSPSLIPPRLPQRAHLSRNKIPSKPSSLSPIQTQHDSFDTNLSFKELGANRTVKIVVIIVLSIAVTVESVFWGKLLWAKFGPETEIEDGKEGKEEGKSE